MTLPQVVGLVGIAVFTMVFWAGLILMGNWAAKSSDARETFPG